MSDITDRILLVMMIQVSLLCVYKYLAFICPLAPWFFCLSWLITWMMSVSLCIHCWCGRFCCWWHGSQSVDLHPLVMLIHIYQRSPFCILLCSYAPRSTAMVVYEYIMWHIMPWICAYITLCLLWYLNIYMIWAISLAIIIIWCEK